MPKEHRATRRFFRLLKILPPRIQEAALKNIELLKNDPSHPSLHFKKVGRFWSIRVGMGHRALATEDEEGYIWFWIGHHDEYMRLIRQG